MGDPLSVTASIIAVGQLSGTIITYIRDAKGMQKECRRLLLDIEYTQGILDLLKDTVQDVRQSGTWEATMKILASNSSPIQRLKDVLEPLRTKLEKQASARGVSRLTRSLLWPLTKDETEDIIRIVEKQKSLLLMAVENDHLLLSNEIKKDTTAIREDLSKVHKDVQHVSDLVSSLNQLHLDDVASKALAWLSPLDYGPAQVDNYMQRHGDSVTWFLETPEYQEWLAGNDKTLFCPGIPGAGKTIIAATVINDLLKKTGHDRGNTALAWTYFIFKDRPSQTIVNVIGCICAQLASQHTDLVEEVKKLYSDSYDRIRRNHRILTQSEVGALFSKCVRKYNKTYLVMDALDEFSHDDMSLISLLNEIRNGSPRLNILVTSRPSATIGSEFVAASNIQVVAQETDLLEYVRESLKQPVFRKHVAADEELKAYIERTLISNSQGMFLLTKLHMNVLQQKARYNKKSLKDAVTDLPKGLDDTFQESLQRISSKEEEEALLARQVLAWIHLSHSFFSPRVLQQAIAVQRRENPEDDDCLIDAELLVSICAGLVIFDEESQIIRLVHYTVEEYFNRKFDEYYPDATGDINHVCLRHALYSSALSGLCSEKEFAGSSQFWWYELQAPRERMERQNRYHFQVVPFSAYAIFHIDLYSTPTGLERIMNRRNRELHQADGRQKSQNILPFLTASLGTAYLILLNSKDFEFRAAVFFNEEAEVCRLLSVPDMHVTPDSLSDGLTYAALSGYNEIVRLLLNTQASVSKMYRDQIESVEDCGYSTEYNFLGLAIKNARMATIELIISRRPELIYQPVSSRSYKSCSGLDALRSLSEKEGALKEEVLKLLEKVSPQSIEKPI